MNKYGMIYLCPNCGHHLTTPLKDGICICQTCQYDISNTRNDRLMAAAWTCYRKNVESYERLAAMLRYEEEELIIVSAFMIDHCFSIEEFKTFLKKWDIKG